MGKDEKISAEPLFRRIAKKGEAAGFAKRLNVSDQVLSNWKRRGVPARELPRVSSALGMSVEKYLTEADYPHIPKVEQHVAQYTIEGQALMQDYAALPSGLQNYIARKAAELRAYADALPQFIREALKAPADPDRYRAWELEIEADIMRRRSEPTPAVAGNQPLIKRVREGRGAISPKKVRFRTRR